MAKLHFQAEFKLEVSGRKKQEGYIDHTEDRKVQVYKKHAVEKTEQDQRI